jgi:hypothetical protein
MYTHPDHWDIETDLELPEADTEGNGTVRR